MDVVYSGSAISTCSSESSSCRVEAQIKDFIKMSFQGFDAFSGSNIPDLAASIDRTCGTEFSSEFELSAGNFSLMLSECVDTFSCSSVPNLNN
jgi:hypothetical protein